jgi:uncharacterized protein YbaR (Trm112 family)
MQMPVKEDLLEILCCPISMERLHVVDAAILAKVNERIASGEVLHEDGETASEPLEEALATESGQRLYAIKDSIPIMLVDESIPSAQLGEEIASSLASSS